MHLKRVMMQMSDILSPEAVLADIKAGSKKQILQEMASAAADLTGADCREIFDTLLERERLGTTGVGGGIAIPHGKLASLNGVMGVFARLSRPVDFDSIDEQPVDLVFLLLAPDDTGADHLKCLARVSRLLRDKEVCQKLRSTDSAAGLYLVLTEAETSQAA